LRQIERWLHQHIFKVGWLLSHNYETTTILYYTIFLPGVLLHEVIYWLMAGVLNVRADRAIQWPEKQEIGNLQLNFIKLSPKANPLKRAVIAATPLITGLLAIWIIAVNIFQLETVMTIAATGSLQDISNAISVLKSTPDFWLWFYISFTIANTMFPTIPKDMKGWWQIGGALVVILIALLILGIGQNLLSNLTLSLGQILNSLSLILMLTITINIIMVILLGAIESAIERITGHSATFQKGKMITMTREEVLKLKQEQQEKRLAARATPRRKTTVTAPASIYMLEFPIPGPPGQEPITKGVAAVLGMDIAGDSPDSIEEDEVFETTATDSTRQRMLKLFGDAENKEEKSIANDMPALPASPSSQLSPTPTDSSDTLKPRPKPEFDVQAFSKPPSDVKDKPKSPHIDDDKSIKRATAKLDSDMESADSIIPDTIQKETDIGKDIKQSSEIPSIPSQRKKINLSPASHTPDKFDDSDEDEDEQLPALLSRRSSILDDIAKPTLSPVNDDTVEDDDNTTDDQTIPAWRNKLNLPKTPTKSDNIVDDEDEDEQLSAPLPRRSSILGEIAKPTLSPIDDTVEDEEDTTDDQAIPAWRNKLNLPKTPTKSDDIDDDEDDEQLSTRLPRRSSIFDDIAKPTPSKTVTSDDDEDDDTEIPSFNATEFSRPFAKREILEDIDDDKESDTDEESVIESSSQFQRPFAPPEKLDTNPLNEPLSSWRSQLSPTPKLSDSDDKDDDEQLSNRLPRRSSMFDSLNKSSESDESNIQKSTSPTPSWRSQLSSTPKQSDSDDDEDDEQLSNRLPRRSSMFDSLNKTSDENDSNKSQSLTPSWRSQLASTPISSESDDEEDDEQLPRTGSLLAGLGRPQPQSPRSTIMGSGSRPAPKPKPTKDTSKQPKSDWRSQLMSDDDSEDEELNYVPIDDEFIYGDDDDDYYDGDDD